MREIILDTETTGFEPSQGHRLVEIGCLEVLNHIPTGKTYHQYINPERDMPAEAEAVHGLTEKFLSDKPTFTEIVGDFLDFIGEDPLVIHNAAFDMKFINAELKTAGFPAIPMPRAVDTLLIAREKFPGSPASLDALCRRFEIDNSSRTLHGALLDAELLAEVYLELMGGRQHGMILEEDETSSSEETSGSESTMAGTSKIRPPRMHAPTDKELAAHKKLIEELGEAAIWQTEKS